MERGRRRGRERGGGRERGRQWQLEWGWGRERAQGRGRERRQERGWVMGGEPCGWRSGGLSLLQDREAEGGRSRHTKAALPLLASQMQLLCQGASLLMVKHYAVRTKTTIQLEFNSFPLI